MRYVSDAWPGIRRERDGEGFRYIAPDSEEKIADDTTLRRIKSLAIPPAWTGVWICPIANGHLQASGRDARGRKQYRYHPRWREVRDETKYSRMIAFAEALPDIRERVEQDLGLPGLPREKVLAAVVRLLETTFIRIGNDEYARANNSFGLTTMQDRHVEVWGAKMRFHFRGKSGKFHNVELSDKRLARIVRMCRDIPGQELFQYVNGDGTPRDVGSADVNDYLREISGNDFTAKDFRTWAGTVLAAMALQEYGDVGSEKQRKQSVVRAVERVAERLGNTPSVCRKCYVHPAVIESYLDGTLLGILRERVDRELKQSANALSSEEASVMRLIEQRLARMTVQ